MSGGLEMLRAVLVTLVVFHSWSPGTVSGEVIYENFQSYQMTGVAVKGPDTTCGGPADEAMRFLLPPGDVDAYTLDAAVVPIARFTGLWCLPDPESWVRVGVYADDNGYPGQELESVLVQVTSTAMSLVTVTFVNGITLETGTFYWLVLCGLGTGNHRWALPDPASTGSRMHRPGSSGSWSAGTNDGAFRIEGTAVIPVPIESTSWGRVKSAFATP